MVFHFFLSLSKWQIYYSFLEVENQLIKVYIVKRKG
nr:MAG TPA: hypothetical protein [Caudoviricetes sp.]